jgi:hypothetical protein
MGRRMSFGKRFAVFTAALLLLVPTCASASGGFVLDLKGQASAGLLVRVPEAQGFGGIELHAAGSVLGIGLFAGLGWERTQGQDDVLQGGYFVGGVELRPLTWGGSRAYQTIDFHVGTGGLIGGLDGSFMAALVFNLGVDIALSSDDQHPVLNIEYRVTSPQIPTEATTYLMMLGFGFRGT